MTAICPHCGYSLTADKPIYRDGWMIDPAGRVAFKGPIHDIKATWAGILYALAASEGNVTSDALLNRVSDSEDVNVIRVQVSKLRKWLGENGLPDPIKTADLSVGGYRWRAPASNFHPVAHEVANA